MGAKGDMGTDLSPRFRLFDNRDVSVTSFISGSEVLSKFSRPKYVSQWS